MRMRRRAGWTLLELMLTGALFMLLITQLGGAWLTFARSMRYLHHRSSLNREALVARTCLARDLLLADHATLGGPATLRLHFTGPHSTVAVYRKAGESLIREDAAAGHAVRVARHLEGLAFTLRPDGEVRARFVFKRGRSQLGLGMTLGVPEALEPGEADRRRDTGTDGMEADP